MSVPLTPQWQLLERYLRQLPAISLHNLCVVLMNGLLVVGGLSLIVHEGLHVFPAQPNRTSSSLVLSSCSHAHMMLKKVVIKNMTNCFVLAHKHEQHY